MDKLPYELYQYILKDLGFYDLIKLRLTCKRLKLIIDDYNIKQLLITPDLTPYKLSGYFDTINYNYRVRLNLQDKNQFKLFKDKILDHDLLRNIKFLQLDYHIANHNFTVTSFFINKFPKLEQLNLLCFSDHKSIIEKINIVHHNLKILNLLTHRIRIKVECLNLEKLNHDLNHQFVKIVYYNTIKYLRVLNDQSITIFELLKFTNLEHFEFRNYRFEFNLKLLIQLPKLKKLTLDNLNDVNGDKSSFKQNSTTITEFIKFKNQQKRDDLIIIIDPYNDPIENLNDFTLFLNFLDSIIESQLKPQMLLMF